MRTGRKRVRISLHPVHLNVPQDADTAAIEHAIKADHGYTLESRAVQNLVEVMAGYDKEERRQFLQL